MSKPSETLRRARSRARAWKTSAKRWRADRYAWQALALALEEIVVETRRRNQIDLEARGLLPTRPASCISCGRVHKTYRSAATKELYLRKHKSIDSVSFCSGSYQPPREV